MVIYIAENFMLMRGRSIYRDFQALKLLVVYKLRFILVCSEMNWKMCPVRNIFRNVKYRFGCGDRLKKTMVYYD